MPVTNVTARLIAGINVEARVSIVVRLAHSLSKIFQAWARSFESSAVALPFSSSVIASS
jgi:hypothetical protein